MNKNKMKPILIDKKLYKDSRGYFQEILKINEIPFNFEIKFTAMSYSKKKVIKSLNFQKKNWQGKIKKKNKRKILEVFFNFKKNF